MPDDDTIKHCFDIACRYLSYRPRSEWEVCHKLRERGFNDRIAAQVINKLKDLKLIDDYAFACLWKDNRLSLKPKSRRMIGQELRDKRVSPEIIDEVTNEVDDAHYAYKLGCEKLPFLIHLDYLDFRRRLSRYLRYRGFDYGVINGVVARLWEEK